MLDVALPISLLVLLIIGGMPIGFALMISGTVGITMVTSWDVTLGVLQTAPFRDTASYALVTIPMFILMAEFITKGGLAKDIFEALKTWTGRLPGGAVVATIFASAGLGAICGSSAAAASTMGKVAVPELKRLGYSSSLSVGSVAVAGTLAIMIPPSTGLLLYALLTGTSIGGMLLAGILPGVLMACALAGVAFYRASTAIRRGEATRGQRYSVREKLRVSTTLWPFLILIFTILAGIYSGAVSAIEASALGAFVALLILIVLRRITFKEFVDASLSTGRLTSMIFIIIAGAGLFGYFLTVSRVPDHLLEAMLSAGFGRWAVLGVILFSIFVLGFFMDQIAILSLAIPIVFPIITELGFNAIWFGILFTCLAEIGLVTPPMGMNVFVASAASGESPEDGFRGTWPYVCMQLVVLMVLIAVPSISTFLVPAGLL